MAKHLFKDNVIPTIANWRKKEINFALVTLIRIDGSSPRPLGSQMVVSEFGDTVGQISGGCCESAIAAEALDSLQNKQNRKRLKFGEGSPFLDIDLPCGSSIEVQIDIEIADSVVSAMEELYLARKDFRLEIPLQKHEQMLVSTSFDHSKRTSDFDAEKVFVKNFKAPLRLILVGEGPLPAMLCKQAELLEMDCIVYSRSLNAAENESPSCRVIDPQKITSHLPAELDERSAVVTLYHDHSREDQCLSLALNSSAFYIGALGSTNTHEKRCQRLQEQGFSDEQLSRIKGPVGIDIRSKNPAAITISIIAQVLLESSKL